MKKEALEVVTPRREEPCFTRNLAVGRMILDLFLYFPPSDMKNSYRERRESWSFMYSLEVQAAIDGGRKRGNLKR